MREITCFEYVKELTYYCLFTEKRVSVTPGVHNSEVKGDEKKDRERGRKTDHSVEVPRVKFLVRH